MSPQWAYIAIVVVWLAILSGVYWAGVLTGRRTERAAQAREADRMARIYAQTGDEHRGPANLSGTPSRVQKGKFVQRGKLGQK